MEKQSSPVEQLTKFHLISPSPCSSAFPATKRSIKFDPKMKVKVMEKQRKPQFRNKQNPTSLHLPPNFLSSQTEKLRKNSKEKAKTKKTRSKNEQIEANIPVSALKLQNILPIRSLNTHILSFHGINFITRQHRPNRV